MLSPSRQAVARAVTCLILSFGVAESASSPLKHRSTGNWTSITCEDPAPEDSIYLPPSVVWGELDAANAWVDIVNTWTQVGKPNNRTFSYAVLSILNGPAGDCFQVNGNCEMEYCGYFQVDGVGGVGAAAFLVWDSIAMINMIYTTYASDLVTASEDTLIPLLDDFYETLESVLPAPNPDYWTEIYPSLVSLVGAMAIGSIFTPFFESMPYFENATNSSDTAESAASRLVRLGLNAISDVAPSCGPFPGDNKNAVGHGAFGVYMSEALTTWSNAAYTAFDWLFNGSDSSIAILGATIANGTMLDFQGNSDLDGDVASPIAKGFFGYAITYIWTQAGMYAFVLDSGHDCDAVNPVSTYMTTNTMQQTGACYNGKLYYLVYPDGEAMNCNCGGLTWECASECQPTQFSAPPGIDKLGGPGFGDFNLTDIIAGAVRTYAKNGNANGAAPVDPLDNDTLSGLMAGDITTPGFITLPVCSGETAYSGWFSVADSSTPGWPCVVPPSFDDASASTVANQTSGGSHLVSGCMGILAKTLLGYLSVLVVAGAWVA